ncbi:coxsackievirus and adenovirus receptor homolog [Centropristis striata]|uniref:coxsackievirus and adenovirus receptor homolog n=1 Tax=Centropristis striata TaxID=184440 RepID=UPI0027E1699B|nr:coxsackievirus and adenovirus receptor homolog [Centropristis striata]XP_059199172.1 coxsackievirus and adenovirus receptor homolog [Centropristis striata]
MGPLAVLKVASMLLLTARGLRINDTASPKITEKAVGENVDLDCRFSTAPEDTGPLEVEWSVKSVRHPMEVAEVLLYSDGQIYDDYYQPLKGRVSFRAEDPGRGDATIHLLLLTPSDSGIYKCQVKKIPGIQNVKKVLRVLKKPSKPQCYYTTGGDAGVGNPKVLHCGSQEGAAPITYFWRREPISRRLPASAMTDHAAGTLTIPDAGQSDGGTYVCTAKNRVGVEECFLEFYVTQTPPVGPIVGGVAGVAGALIALGLITYFLKRRLRGSEAEPAPNDIVVDASPPRRRVRFAAEMAQNPFPPPPTPF